MAGTVAAARARSLAAPTLATLVALAILLALGTWQVARKDWKEGLIAQIQARAYGEPGAIVPEASWPAFDAAAQEYRRVRLTGTFLHDREALVHGLMPSQTRGQPIQGFYVMTPLRLSDGGVVLVNRGFVPTQLRDPATRAAGRIDGEAAVVGLVRASQQKAAFVPENDPAANAWFTRDLGQIADARGLTRVAPFYVDAQEGATAGDWPRPGGTILDLPNNHLNYALTWYGLALTLVAVYGAFVWRRLKGRD